jgi:hypothetical protein
MTVANHLTLNELWRRAKKAKDPIEKDRFLAVYHAKRGLTAKEIARIIPNTPRWVQETVRRYNLEGPEALKDKRHQNPGQKPKLTPEERMRVLEALHPLPRHLPAQPLQVGHHLPRPAPPLQQGVPQPPASTGTPLQVRHRVHPPRLPPGPGHPHRFPLPRPGVGGRQGKSKPALIQKEQRLSKASRSRGAVQASSPDKSSRRKALMAGVQRGLAPGGLPSSSPSMPLSSHRLRSRWRVVRSRPRWRAMRGAVQPWAARRTAWARRRTLKGTTGLVSSSRSRASSSGVRWMRRGAGMWIV